MARRAVIADSVTGEVIWPPVFGVGLVATPSGDSDFSMFPGSIPPTAGTFISVTNTELWIFSAGMVPAQWRHAPITL